jgi:integrase
MHKKDELSQDSEGRYKRWLGWKHGNGGKMIQHLFRLGRDKEKALAANRKLEAVWESVVARWKERKARGGTDEPCPVWDDVTLAIGTAVARGEDYCVLQPLPGTSAPVAADWLAWEQAHFPMIRLRLPEEMLRAAAAQAIQYAAEDWARLHQETAQARDVVLAALGEPLNVDLDKALAAYDDYLASAHKGKPSLRPRRTAVILLRKHLDKQQTLANLDADAIERWLAYWCRRPVGDKRSPLAYHTCRNVLLELRRFLLWLQRSPAFPWELPRHFVFPRCHVDKLPAERVKKRPHFTLEELKIIWQYAKPWDRALILLALNCGFSKREIATLQVGEVVQGKKHTFIKRHRTKTDVYGEWVLWPETLEALEYLKQFRPENATFAVANQNGKPMTDGTKGGNENQVIKNHWDWIMGRVLTDYPDFYRLPFKHLRKTGANMLRHLPLRGATGLPVLYLAHGEQGDSRDVLLPAYTSRRFVRLHLALLRLRKMLLPVFATVANPWEGKPMRTTPKTLARVKELRAAGKKLKEIAAEVGLHWVTVGKICRQQKPAERTVLPRQFPLQF